MDFFCLYDEEVVFAAVYMVLMKKSNSWGLKIIKMTLKTVLSEKRPLQPLSPNAPHWMRHVLLFLAAPRRVRPLLTTVCYILFGYFLIVGFWMKCSKRHL